MEYLLIENKDCNYKNNFHNLKEIKIYLIETKCFYLL